jgi:hypothetical protein
MEGAIGRDFVLRIVFGLLIGDPPFSAGLHAGHTRRKRREIFFELRPLLDYDNLTTRRLHARGPLCDEWGFYVFGCLSSDHTQGRGHAVNHRLCVHHKRCHKKVEAQEIRSAHLGPCLLHQRRRYDLLIFCSGRVNMVRKDMSYVISHYSLFILKLDIQR